jgi:hypothetical protein
VTPHIAQPPRAHRPQFVRLIAAVLTLLAVLAWVSDADADRRRRKPRRGRGKPAAAQPAAPAAPGPGVNVPGAAATPTAGGAATTGTSGKKGKDQVFDFTGLELAGSMRMPQLLYFLDRAEEELERASLERRSFVPEMVRSVEEEAL